MEANHKLNLSGKRFSVLYRVQGTEKEALARAMDIRIEQTVEFPEDLVPQSLAAFEGRRSVAQAGGVTVTLLAGTLRAVTAERPVARRTWWARTADEASSARWPGSSSSERSRPAAT